MHIVHRLAHREKKYTHKIKVTKEYSSMEMHHNANILCSLEHLLDHTVIAKTVNKEKDEHRDKVKRIAIYLEFQRNH